MPRREPPATLLIYFLIPRKPTLTLKRPLTTHPLFSFLETSALLRALAPPGTPKAELDFLAQKLVGPSGGMRGASAAKASGGALSHPADALFDAMDADGNGVIDRAEFLAMAAHLQAGGAPSAGPSRRETQPTAGPAPLTSSLFPHGGPTGFPDSPSLAVSDSEEVPHTMPSGVTGAARSLDKLLVEAQHTVAEIQNAGSFLDRARSSVIANNAKASPHTPHPTPPNTSPRGGSPS